jgi:SAM-dependent methyltransferase
MLALAPQQFDRAAMDAGQLAFCSCSMDRVLMIFMLFHLAAPAAGLCEARRVLRAGGQVGTVTWGSELESQATRVWTQCLDAHGADQADPATVSRHDRVDTTEKMKGLLLEAGFDDVLCWVDDLVLGIDAEHLLRLRTSLGSMKPRFDSLAAEARAACLAEARRRMEGMPSEAFVARAKLIYSVARA